jgi:hypothetical protein
VLNTNWYFPRVFKKGERNLHLCPPSWWLEFGCDHLSANSHLQTMAREQQGTRIPGVWKIFAPVCFLLLYAEGRKKFLPYSNRWVFFRGGGWENFVFFYRWLTIILIETYII